MTPTAAAAQPGYRPLFLGRRHWLRGARRRSLADPVDEGTFAFPEWPAEPASATQR